MIRSAVANLAKVYLEEHGETIDDWDGFCGDLADKVAAPFPDAAMIWVDGEIGHGWRFHMAPEIDGLIHDAWCPGDALPIEEWLATMFGDGWVEVNRFHSLDEDPAIRLCHADQFPGWD
jgi:hypothetical protein